MEQTGQVKSNVWEKRQKNWLSGIFLSPKKRWCGGGGGGGGVRRQSSQRLTMLLGTGNSVNGNMIDGEGKAAT